MERVSQLILRNAELMYTGQVLFINPPRDSCFSRISQDRRRISVFSQDFADYNYLDSGGAKAVFGLIPSVDSNAQDIVLIMPRERERLEMLLHAIASSMPPQSILWLAGENRAGIKSSGKKLRSYFASVAKVDSARHCALFRACNPVALHPFNLEHYKRAWPLNIFNKQLKIISLPGTFAHGKLDRGTSLLLDALEDLKPSGRVLDFACGNGVIGLSLLSLQPAKRLTLLDVSAPALESTRCSLIENGMEAIVLASNGLSHLEGSYDWIITNPPFHRGISNDLDVARNFFANAGDFLKKTGKILLVCNHHLPYPTWLRDYFTRVEVLRASGGFKVILATGSRR